MRALNWSSQFRLTKSTLTELLLAVITFACGQDTCAAKITDDSLLIRTIHYRQTPNIVSEHSRNDVV